MPEYKPSLSMVLRAVQHEYRAEEPREPAEEVEWKKFSAWLLRVVIDRKRPLKSMCAICQKPIIFRPREWEHCCGRSDHVGEPVRMQRD
ncbi:hypothetical protein [Vallicoccus soli]|uniref:hypothetical protein n=1 Tax=Vallicoccus soli TaxID=2339232 RepID=UPI001059DF6E|nr:hypothetical protein [Vallicoccus soli]